MKITSFTQLFEQAKKEDAYWVADAIHVFIEKLFNMANAKQITKAELARRLGTSPAYITKIFRGNANFTIGSMVRLARAVRGKLVINIEEEISKDNNKALDEAFFSSLQSAHFENKPPILSFLKKEDPQLTSVMAAQGKTRPQNEAESMFRTTKPYGYGPYGYGQEPMRLQ